ncbi:MAG: DUF4440 domain-containing protein [Rhizobiales bacterium]|nr:DUF4440 domain-containing protein [Hyphomicrobiales bacterium]
MENAMTNTPDMPPHNSSMAPDRTQDVDLIRRTIANVELTQRNRDPEGFMRLLARNAVWVTALGRRLTGWDEISAFTHRVLTPSLGDHYASYEVAHITFLCDTIAAVNVVQRPVEKSGALDEDEPEGRPLYVMTKLHGDWLITIGQNTRFQADAIDAQSNAVETQ